METAKQIASDAILLNYNGRGGLSDALAMGDADVDAIEAMMTAAIETARAAPKSNPVTEAIAFIGKRVIVRDRQSNKALLLGEVQNVKIHSNGYGEPVPYLEIRPKLTLGQLADGVYLTYANYIFEQD